jgi:hypothetical protein
MIDRTELIKENTNMIWIEMDEFEISGFLEHFEVLNLHEWFEVRTLPPYSNLIYIINWNA